MYLEPFQQHKMIGNELKVPYSIDTHFFVSNVDTRDQN